MGLWMTILDSQKTYCTHPLRRRRGATRRSVLSRARTPTSWMLSAQDATRSQRCSATPRRLCCVWVAPQFCVSPLEAKHVSQRGAHSGGSSISCKRSVRGGVGHVDLSDSSLDTEPTASKKD
ncbi:uncharacterized protein ACWYII_021881 isoform 1-T1 [Salvelinus alpinus]